jgi:hypothetical protein
MHIPEKNAKILGQNCIVLVAVRQMRSMQAVLSEEFMNRDVNFLENVWNVRL